MNMPGSSTSSSSEAGTMAMVIPYLHFTGGDYLFFSTVAPASRGAIAGACITLAVIAVLERAVAGARGFLALYMDHRQRTLFRVKPAGEVLMAIPGDVLCAGKATEIEASTGAASPELIVRPLPVERRRSMGPFLWSYELVRGGLFIVQSFFVYAIMLAVMTFNAAYIISIIAGTVMGEILFGRFVVGQAH
ncbi:hypothetical protein RSOLAG1IB_03019 [Rhizoctonia solani AG-1 IB]|uniref:Copper transport protein n=2 Tax=Thanatephorus cucumeris (strain AG1-IB / isolate 7/3/14) TaxID=1108050 RepID=A0A0B7FPW8_THACB|nr:hypothetical protein RSOLAG1IB_03019 [Rhizoctonia solani AG-1 IB]